MGIGATQAVSGYGAQVWVSDGAGGWLQVAEMSDLTPPDRQRSVINATHMKSPRKYTESIAGMKSVGDPVFSCSVLPGDVTATRIAELFESGARGEWRITFPEADARGLAFSFQAFVQREATTIDPESKFIKTFTLKVTGELDEIAWTPPGT